MKFTLSTLIITLTFFGYSQPQTNADSLGYEGSVKSVYTYKYIYDKSDSLFQNKALHPTCEVCDHYQRFNRKGRLIEEQKYVIIEPVNDLEMGFCHNQVFKYEDDELIEITSQISEGHGLGTWEDQLKKEMNGATYTVVKDQETTIINHHTVWGREIQKYFLNGLLMKDQDKTYSYDNKDRLIKTVEIDKNSPERKTTNTWVYNDDLLVVHSTIQTGGYYFGNETKYDYYESGKLLSKKEYRLGDPEDDSEKTKIISAHFYYENGRDSSHFSVHRGVKNSFDFVYEFHPNGEIATKSKVKSSGELVAYDTYDDRGNLTQHNQYNIHFEAYNIEKLVYNNQDQLIEKSITDNYREEQYSYIYKYDEQGNRTHTYRKNNGVTFLLEKNEFKYHR